MQTVIAQGEGAVCEHKNEIVVYQPDETIRLETRYSNDSIWLTQLKIAELFGEGPWALVLRVHQTGLNRNPWTEDENSVAIAWKRQRGRCRYV